SQNGVHLPSKAQDISTSQPSDRRVHSFLQLRAAPDKDWPGSALASPGQSLIQSILLLPASFLCCPLNLDRFTGRGTLCLCFTGKMSGGEGSRRNARELVPADCPQAGI